MKIGLLTSGGDCPGLNAVIRGAVLNGVKKYGYEFVGFRDGWRGVVEGDYMDLPRQKVRGLASQGGTIIGTSRTNPFDGPNGGPENIEIMMERHGIDAIVAIGGEGTLAGAASGRRRPARHRCSQDHRQRFARNRLHLRLRHRSVHRNRGDGPHPHHR